MFNFIDFFFIYLKGITKCCCNGSPLQLVNKQLITAQFPHQFRSSSISKLEGQVNKPQQQTVCASEEDDLVTTKGTARTRSK